MNVIRIIDVRIKELRQERARLGSERKGAWTRKRKASGIFHRIQELEQLKRRLWMPSVVRNTNKAKQT